MTDVGSVWQPTNVSLTHPLTIMTSRAISVRTDPGVFLNVFSNLTLEGDFSISTQAFHISSGGLVTQTGSFNATFDTAVGVEIAAGGVYNQQGSLRLSGSGQAKTGVANNGEWNQQGSLVVDMSALTQAPTGVMVDKGAVWRQNGTMQIESTANGVLLYEGEWYQNAHVSISVATSPSPSLTYLGAIAVGNGMWRQNAETEVISTLVPGVVFDNSQPDRAQPRWIQRERIFINSTSSTNWPINALSLVGVYWEQYANVSLIVSEDSPASPINCTSELWKVLSGYLSITPANRYDLGACKMEKPFSSSNSTSTTTLQQPILQFDQETNAVRIVPRVAEGGESATVVKEATVELAFAVIREMSANGTVLQVGRAVYGAWEAATQNSIGASQAFVFSSPVTIDGQAFAASSNGGRIKLELFLFDAATNVSVGDVATFVVLPSLTKLTVAMWSWPWLSNTSRVELSVGVSPRFARVTHAPAGGGDIPITTITLQGQNSTTTTNSKRAFETQVRFLSVVELDGVVRSPADQAAGGRAPVEFSADPESSSLVLSFAYFASNMSYDPDLGVLVGGHGDKDSSGDEWIAVVVGVSVAVPVAIAVVALVVAVAIVVERQQRKRVMQRHRQRSKLTVEFSSDL